MDGFWRKAVTLLLLLVVAYVLISPAFDLAPSANRAWRAALQLMAVIAALASLLISLVEAMFLFRPVVEVFDDRGRPNPLLFTCVCIR
jgi:hypothetical protein